ncbi:MAG: hypothetical protein AB7I40_21055 [Nocardioides sp.]
MCGSRYETLPTAPAPAPAHSGPTVAAAPTPGPPEVETTQIRTPAPPAQAAAPLPPVAPPAPPVAPVPPVASAVPPVGLTKQAPTAPAPPTPQPAAPNWTPPPAPPGWQPQGPPGYPAAPRINPFLGVPISDFVRDAAALFCLFAAFGMPWDLNGDATDRWWVVIALLLSLASLAIPYVAKAQLIPGFGPAESGLAKFAANVPALLAVFAAIVNELVNLGNDFEGGLGIGIATALAGITLAVQPRAAEEGQTHRTDELWVTATIATASAALAVGIVAFVGFAFDWLDLFGSLSDSLLTLVGLTLAAPVTFIVLIGWPTVGILKRKTGWIRVFSVITFTVVAVCLLSLAGDGSGVFFAQAVEKWNYVYGGTFLIGAAAGLSVSRPIHRARLERDPVSGWIETATAALSVAAAALGVSGVALIIAMIDRELTDPGLFIAVVLIICSTVAAVVAISLLHNPRQNRPIVLAVIGGYLLASIVTVSLLRSFDYQLGMNGWEAAFWFTLPTLAIYALVVPTSVRTALAIPRPTYPPQGGPPPHQPGYPQHPAAGGWGDQAPPPRPPYPEQR